MNPADAVHLSHLTSEELNHELLARAIKRTEAALRRAQETLDVLNNKLARQRLQYMCQAKRLAQTTDQPYPWFCTKCNTRVAHPELLGTPGHCPQCNTLLI